MSLRFYRRTSFACLALIALCLHLLLPFAHAMQLSSDPLAGLTLCSAAKNGQSIPLDSPTSHSSTMQCPICVASAGTHMAPPPAPSALPSIREHISPLRLVRIEGFFTPTHPYTLPLSHAPPCVFA
ncbi:DUF2946 family protein [Chitinibacter bivalviorum]|uniref:DUF2946 family protein n=1 Tax=Chitinibacter bivalviorum TaxID=2739434 RepID=A0A7H9BR28_9NEIS|nr:DUF2946 family protein [Chitinibacter bivalviorum]QLG89684.1 DUF2946 family protein [Chitinibacter bivalviorum]